jgi:hypothetical protein
MEILHRLAFGAHRNAPARLRCLPALPSTMTRADTDLSVPWRYQAPNRFASTSGSRNCSWRHPPAKWEGGFGILLLLVWTVVFSIGVIFPSKTYLTEMRAAATGQAELSGVQMLGRLTAFLLSYTATNAAILTCLAAWLGELGRRTRIDGDDPEGRLQRGDYVAAVMRGFFGYLAMISGFVVLGSGIKLLTDPQQEEYIRLSAFVSLLGFLAGFSPIIFRGIEDRLTATVRVDNQRGVVAAQLEGVNDLRVTTQAAAPPPPRPPDPRPPRAVDEAPRPRGRLEGRPRPPTA